MATPIRSPRRRQVGLREYFFVDGRFTVSPNTNNWLPPSPTVTPDESIIRQRGRKSPSIAPTRTSPRKSPRKSLSVNLNQTEITELDASTGETPLIEKATETPVRTNLALRGVRKRLVLCKDNDVQDENSGDPDYSQTAISPPKKKKGKKSVSAKNDKDELREKLKALSQQQIIDVVLKVVDGNTSLHQDILLVLPSPDISPLIKQLEMLRRNILKSMPYTRFGSYRDAFCFRRVKTHVTSFKAALVSHGKQLSKTNSWYAAIDYVQQAWEEVNNLPDWDNESHCKIKQGCYRSLAALAKQAIRGSSLEKHVYTDFKDWLVESSEFHPEIKPCIAMVEKNMK